MEIKRCYDTLVGASVAENQIDPISETSRSLTRNGITLIDNRDGSYTFYTDAGGATANTDMTLILVPNAVIRGHVYVLTGAPNGQSTSTFQITDMYNGVLSYAYRTENVHKAPVVSDPSIVTARLDFRLYVKMGFVQTTPITFRPQTTDLTAYFGSTIADYIYSLETATAGAGIAKLREWGFLRGYKAYNSGSIESVEVTEKKCVGFNQWDEVWEVGTLDASGNTVSNNSSIRSKNYIPVIGGSDYCVHASDRTSIWANVSRYDADKNFIAQSAGYSNTVYTLEANTAYIKFYVSSYYGATYNHDICINLSSDRNGEYEPYKSITYSLGNDVLRGIFKLDANNNLYADGDRKEADGTITRRYKKITIDGNTTISAGSSGMPFLFIVSDKKNYEYNELPNIVSDKLQAVTQASTWGIPFTIAFARNTTMAFFKLSDSITTIEDAKTWLASNPITLVYELATPTTEQSTPFAYPQIVYPDGTEEFVTENGVPVGHETKYQL